MSAGLSSDSIPKRDFLVRRRKYEGQCWLIVRTSFYEIDEVVEHVWLGCNGDARIGEIAENLAEQMGMSLAAAETTTRSAVRMLLDLGLVHIR